MVYRFVKSSDFNLEEETAYGGPDWDTAMSKLTEQRVPVAPDNERFRRFFTNSRPHIRAGYSAPVDCRTTRQITRERVAAFLAHSACKQG